MRRLNADERRAIGANSGILAASETIGGLGAGVFQVYALDVIGMAPRVLGLLFLAQLSSIPAQLYGAAVAGRTRYSVMMRRGYLLVLGVVLLLVVAPSTGGAFAIALVIAAAIIGECAISYSWGSVWQAWVQWITRPEVRGRMLGSMRLAAQGTAIVFALFASRLAGDRLTSEGFYVLAALVAGYLLVALVLYGRLPEPKPRPEDHPDTISGPWGRHARDERGLQQIRSDTARLRSTMGRLAQSSDLRRLAVLVAVVEALGPSLLVTYLLTVADYPSSTAITILVARQVVALTALRPLGRIVDRFSAQVVVRASLVMTAVASLCWVVALELVLASPVLLGVLVAAGSIALNALGLGVLALAHDRIPTDDAAVAFSLYDLVESSVNQIALGISGFIIAGAAALGTFGVGVIRVDLYTGWVAAGGIAALLCLPLTRISTPSSTEAHREEHTDSQDAVD